MQPPSKTQQPWDFDATVYNGLLQEMSKGEKPFYLAPAGQKDWEQVLLQYQRSPSPGLEIANVEVIWNKAMLKGFLAGLEQLEQRGFNSAFEASWIRVTNYATDLRKQVHQSLLACSDKKLKGFQHVKVAGMFHGTRKDLIASILKTNFANLAKVDAGFFGQGIYFTSSAQYAESYQGDRTLLFNWVAFFSAHPVHYDDDQPMWDYLRQYDIGMIDPSLSPTKKEYERAFANSKHYGKGNLPGYDAHYAQVISCNPTNPREMKYFPIQDGQQATYDELVVFQSSQILPRYVVTLGPTGIKLKQLPAAPHTVDNLIQAISAAEKYPGLTPVLLQLLQKLKVSLPSSKKLLTAEQNWLLAHIACLSFQCDQQFKQKAIHKLMGYYQEVELPVATPSALATLFSQVFSKKELPKKANLDLKIIAALQIGYRQSDTIRSLFGGVTLIEQCYTDLVIVNREEKKVKNEEENAAKSSNEKKETYHDLRLSSWEDIQAAKAPIALSMLFERKSEKDEPKRILLVGRAGMGKSTLCQYISYSWASLELWKDKFEAIIWIPLRTLKNFHGDTSAFILQYCIPSLEKGFSHADLVQFLQAKKEKILFILDGYDEAQFPDNSSEAKILRELMHYPRWLITSRPYAIQGIIADRTLECVGFSKAQVHEYLSKALPEDKAQSLKLQFQTNPWLEGISHVPLNLELICHLWKVPGNTNFESMAALYRKFSLEIQRWYLQKNGHLGAAELEEGDFEKIDSQFANIMQLIEEVAWQGLEGKNLLISFQNPKINPFYMARRPADFEQRAAFNQLIKEVGFLQSTGSDAQLMEDTFYFAHLTFQEFFAARYLYRLFATDPKQAEVLFQSQKFNPQFQIVYWFLAGLLKTHPTELKLFFTWLNQPKDLVGFYAFQLRMHCLEECSWPDSLEHKELYLQEALNWCRWLFNPILGNLIKDALVELFRTSPRLCAKLTPLLQQVLDNCSKSTKRLVARNLAGSGQHFADNLLPLLTDNQKMGATVKALPEISEMLKALPTSTDSIAQVLLLHLKVLKDKNKLNRRDAVKELGKFVIVSPQSADQLLSPLLQVIKDTSSSVRSSTVEALGQLVTVSSASAEQVLSPLLQSLKDENSDVRSNATKALGQLVTVSPTSAEQVLSPLLQALKDEHSAVRVNAAEALGQLVTVSPASADQVLSSLVQALKDEHSAVRANAAKSLVQLVTVSPTSVDQVIPLFLNALKNRFNNSFALDALVQFAAISPTKANQVLVYLLQLLKDNDRRVRATTAKALGQLVSIAPASADQVLSPLLQALKDNVSDVRRSAVKALGQLVSVAPAGADQVLSPLLQALKDEDFVRMSAAKALWKLVAVSPKSVDQGLIQLKDILFPFFKETSYDKNIDFLNLTLSFLQVAVTKIDTHVSANSVSVPLWILLTKCYRDSIPLFIDSDKLCFYKNGKQQIDISHAEQVFKYLSLGSSNYPITTLNAYIQIIAENPSKVYIASIPFSDSNLREDFSVANAESELAFFNKLALK